VYTQDCVAKYNVINWEIPTSGYIIYNEANEQTNLQLINNAGLVTFSEQLQNGGGLVSGGYRYSVRFGVNGTGNTTEWSVLTPNAIPVFKTSVNNPTAYIRIQGDKSGETTGKANILLVQNALPNIYNFVELACVYSAGGANSASIVGRFDVTSSDFTVIHTGFEQGVISLPVDVLPQTDPVILKAKSLEIKKNRLNLANVEIASDDNDILAVAQGVTIAPARRELEGVGKFNYDSPDFVTISNSNGYSPWNANLLTLQTGAGIPIIFPNVSPITPDYNTSSGRYTAAVAGDYEVKFGFGIEGAVTFQGNLNIIELIKVSGAVRTVITSLPISNRGYFSVTISLAVNDEIHLAATYGLSNTINYLFTNAASGTGFSINRLTAASYAFRDTRVGEYQLPENCAKYVGYTLNEKYPMFMKTHHESGYISLPFYCGMFDNDWDGGAFLFTNNSPASSYKTYAYYANISNIHISPLRNLQDPVIGISFWRGICNPTVLGTGVVMPADSFDVDRYMSGFYSSIPTTNGAYGSIVGATDNRRKFAMFFSHDTRINQVEPVEGDTLKCYSPTNVLNNFSGVKSSTVQNGLGSYAEYSGYLANLIEEDVTITDGVYTTFDNAIGEVDDTQPIIRSGSLNYRPNINVKNKASGSMENISIAVDNFIDPNPMVATDTDNGLYPAQYIRNISNQYDIQSVKIVPTGTYIKIDQNTPNYLNNVAVFGGDTYTQKNILKVRYWSNFNSNEVRTSFITYYGQNKINTQLFYNDNEAPKVTWNLQGHLSISQYLFPFLNAEEVVEEQFNYDRGYSEQYPLFINAYNPNLPSESKFISRIYYSQQKPINSLQDFYRKVLAFDFRDLDTKNGNIAAIRDVNNYMVAVQPRAISVLPYLSDVALTSQGGGQVLVGTGGVYNQRENIISTYGTSLQTCTLVGNNNNGNSTLYWFSPEFKKYCRYGGDGIKVLSDDNSMRSFFLTMVAQAEYDMVQVFDIEHASVIMTWGGAQSKTLFFNEKSNNFSSFASFIPLRYFPYQNITLAPRISATDYNQIYELSGGTNYLSYLGAASSVFRIEYVANKGGMSSKRFLSAALSVGEGYTFTNPAVSMSVNGDVVFPHTITTFQKRHDNWFGAFNKAAGKQPIGQYGVVKVESSAYIVILGAVTKFRNIFRSLFK